MKSAIIVQDLGFGDAGKGSVVDYLCRILPADLVVRFCGGPQCSHQVVLPGGKYHRFSQFGAGTLTGIPTYLGPKVIINPVMMDIEAVSLEETYGINNPLSLLSVHEDCLVTTMYHRHWNQITELMRGEARHGSCGAGIGMARLHERQRPESVIRARDLQNYARLKMLLHELKECVVEEVNKQIVADTDGNNAWAVRELAVEMKKADPVIYAVRMCHVGTELRLVTKIPEYNLAIFEGAQGVLLDEYCGFHPHTTWNTVTRQHADVLIAASAPERVSCVGVLRAYQTRHGAGPLPTFDASLHEHLTDPGNPENQWQGSLRFGHLDLMLLRYALACNPVDCLAVNHLDQLNQSMQICTAYEGWSAFPISHINPVTHETERLLQQAQFGRMLEQARPVYQHCDDPLPLLQELAPVSIVGRGPTWQEKQGLPLVARRHSR